MAGSLLVSGNPQHYKAIGEGGQPVYSVAFQLREAIRLKAGATTANCLAIPQSNQHGSSVDWYAPTEGEVVPWTAASSQEREHALSKLDAAHRALDRAIAQMSQSQSRDAQAEREKNTVLPLMSKVFYFPDTNFIYLVNGEPVIAFWGFHSEGTNLPADPFTHLRPVSAPAVAEVQPTQTTQPKRSWWWWLLLLLLLLLLLFFLLRSCAPGILPFSVQPSPSVSTDVRSGVPVTPGSPLSTGVVNPPAVSAQPDALVDRGVSWLRRWWSGTGSDLNVAPGVTAPDRAISPDVTTNPDAAPSDTGTTPTTTPTPGGADASASAADASSGAAPTSTPPPSSTPADTSPPNPANQPSPDTSATPSPDPARNSASGAQSGRPMTIPQQALNSGDTRFLDGSWNAGTGIQDAKTGKPLRMEYDFSQGNGQGKVTIRRADGSQCVGSVSAQMQSRTLQISDRGVAKCSDGGTMALPKVTCTPQADGRADCQGRYENGTTFPVSMRHSPK